MHKNARKCNKTQSKWCTNKHGASKIIDMFEMYQTYVEEPSKILAENWKLLRNRAIKYCKVQWKHHPERDATWEKEEDLRTTYPEFFRYT
jgi:hypothetical protein